MAILHVRQGITYRAVFSWSDTSGPISMAGYRARFRAIRRVGSDPIIDITSDTSPESLQVEPGGATGQVHLRLGADQTEVLVHDGVYEVDLISETDATEAAYVSSGTIDLTRPGE